LEKIGFFLEEEEKVNLFFSLSLDFESKFFKVFFSSVLLGSDHHHQSSRNNFSFFVFFILSVAARERKNEREREHATETRESL
tara:strand:+ start:11842 stop:12090 length:249 start_codon:yes stop_codon:yes gene_type:complete